MVATPRWLLLLGAMLAALLPRGSHATLWCTAPPDCHVHWMLKEAAEARNLTLLHFPVPTNRWPDPEVLSTCKYIAYCPFYQDGLGSQYHRVLTLLGFSYRHNVSFLYIPLEKLEHHVSIDEAEAFFNLGQGEVTLDQVPDGATVCLADNCGLQARMQDVLLDKLRSGSTKDAPYVPGMNPSRLLVAVHIRRGDVMNRTSDIEQGRYKPNSWYVELLANMTADLEGMDYEVHVFTEGKLKDFEVITSAYPNLHWHISEDPFTSLRGLMCADVLVKASSSFSHIVHHYYTTGIVIEPRQGWHAAANPELARWNVTKTLLQQRMLGRRLMRGC